MNYRQQTAHTKSYLKNDKNQDVLLKYFLISLVVIIASFSSVLPLFAEIQINPIEMNQNSLELITISGFVDTDISQALIVVSFPDGLEQEHIILVGKDGVFKYFVNPGSEFPSGTFLVSVYDENSKKKPLEVGAFNIYNSESSSFDFVIKRGTSTKTCDECIEPGMTSILEKSIMTFYNKDSVVHDIQNKKKSKKTTIGLLEPGESKSVYATGSGINNYYCTIHPWVYGTIFVIKNKFDFPVREIIQNGLEGIPEKTTESVLPCDSCSSGIVTKVVNGDTLNIDKERIRLALVDTPKGVQPGYHNATEFTKNMCPVGSVVFYDIDEKQPTGKYGRTIAEVFCNGASLNGSLLENHHGIILITHCEKSEFSQSVWARDSCTINSDIIKSDFIDEVTSIADSIDESIMDDDVIPDDLDSIIPPDEKIPKVIPITDNSILSDPIWIFGIAAVAGISVLIFVLIRKRR